MPKKKKTNKRRKERKKRNEKRCPIKGGRGDGENPNSIFVGKYLIYLQSTFPVRPGVPRSVSARTPPPLRWVRALARGVGRVVAFDSARRALPRQSDLYESSIFCVFFFNLQPFFF